MEQMKTKFLHGTIEITILHATPQNQYCLPFDCACIGAKPAYVAIELGEAKVAETSQELDRIWNQSFRIPCAHPANTSLNFTLRTSISKLGSIQVPANAMLMDGETKLEHGSGLRILAMKGTCSTEIKLRFSVRFRHAESVGASWGLVDEVTFQQRSNCKVILYQDAHHLGSFGSPVRDWIGQPYRPRRLWEDVFKAIDGAKHLIYIAGWSLNPKMVLVRDPNTEIPQARGVTLGELLIKKAEGGVAVRIILWDDETSLHMIGNRGVMNTHDEDASKYFERTKVVCRLCPRLHHSLPTLFTHHQKTIAVDADPKLFEFNCTGRDSSSRQVISFVGGLDLCDGRYDTEEHSLFRGLTSEMHAEDFYQTSISHASLDHGGPREPWHDAHACIIGEAALDVLANFEQRWMKQCQPALLVPLANISPLADPHPWHADHTSWNVQVFRSIDTTSARGLPDHIIVEDSIHQAYIQAIRRAERFIYIENQYFIGGCHLWSKDEHSGCKNLIPVEIALKVASKIRAGERFAVYIVMPMWPEGAPESEAVQDILHWTRLTMEMMYKLVAEAILDSGRKYGHPRDYLNFFCLANREVQGSGEFAPPYSPPHATQYWKAQSNRRFMIYVHSKLMIVDDEYILIGSANINQRSMDGGRDTEIAIGCHQPNFSSPKYGGDVQLFRMSLWYEHTNCIEEAFLTPESIECVRRLKQIGEDMWNAYTQEDIIDMGRKHLVTYPVHTSEEGVIHDLVQGGTFPDTAAPIEGRRSNILPPICTT